VAQSTNKKVLVVRFDREPVEGFVQSTADPIEVLTPEGNLLKIPATETKVVCFVRDFDGNLPWPPVQRTFLARPKTPGIWVKLLFRDGDTLEGVLANNLVLLEPGGFSILPPDSTRIYAPRQSLREVQVLGVIGSSARRKTAKKPAEGQLEMFGE
jgi:Family of unknown function (DUF6982)